ncbi:MAG: DMT family transporter [Myxococcales bacterium]|nr:DMT family transporter [Myxococcales bacterium]
MSDPRKAYLYAGGTVLMWSSVATAFKITLRAFEPAQLAFAASVVSTGVLAVTVGLRGQLGQVWPTLRARPLLYVGLGLLNPCLYYLTLLEGYARLPAQQAQPLNFTWAITLALLSVPLLGQRLHGRDLIACLLGYGGVLVIATRGDVFSLQFEDGIGVGCVLASTIIWSLYWIGNARNPGDPVLGLLLCFLCGVPFTALGVALFSDFAMADWHGLLGAAYIGFFEMGLAFVLWLLALRHAENTARVTSLAFLSPFLSLFFIANIVGEPIHPATFIGLGLIVAGLLAQRFLRG